MMGAVQVAKAQRARKRRGVFLSDENDELRPWLESVRQDQERRHPGRTSRLAGIVREALEIVRRNPDLEAQLRR